VHKALWYGTEQPASVSAFTIGGNRATMHHPAESLHCILQNLMIRSVIKLRDQAKTAAVPELFSEIFQGAPLKSIRQK
jgi:hypothetical protein